MAEEEVSMSSPGLQYWETPVSPMAQEGVMSSQHLDFLEYIEPLKCTGKCKHTFKSQVQYFRIGEILKKKIIACLLKY